MSWKGALTNLFESPCDKLVITLTRDAYEKYNSRALRALEVIFPVIITWSCYNYHLLNVTVPLDFLAVDETVEGVQCPK